MHRCRQAAEKRTGCDLWKQCPAASSDVHEDRNGMYRNHEGKCGQGLLLGYVGVANAVGASADSWVWKGTTVVEGVDARFAWQINLLNDLSDNANVTSTYFVGYILLWIPPSAQEFYVKGSSQNALLGCFISSQNFMLCFAGILRTLHANSMCHGVISTILAGYNRQLKHTCSLTLVAYARGYRESSRSSFPCPVLVL